MPDSHWIIGSGLADEASFFLIDSRSGAWRPLAFEVKPDTAFTICASPPVLGNFNTHGLSIRSLRSTIAATIDARTFQHDIIVETPPVADFSNATMVLPIGHQFWLGTSSGYRIARGTLR